MSDLINRLRGDFVPSSYHDIKSLLTSAADTLEAKDKEIAELREQVFWLNAARPSVAIVAENEQIKALCDQMGEALERCVSDDLSYIRESNEALTAWRAMK